MLHAPNYLLCAPAELEDIIGDVIQTHSKLANDPLSAQQIVDHIMKSCLRDEWVAQYVESDELRVRFTGEALPKDIGEELVRLQPVSSSGPLR